MKALSPTSCAECDALMKQHQAAAEGYDQAVAQMTQLRGPEFDQAWQQAENARGLRKRARRALLRHQRERGCESHQSSSPTVANPAEVTPHRPQI